MSASRVRAYVGLGSNLQDPRRQLTAALAALAGLRVTRLVASSSLYRSPPLGPPGQPEYLNAVAALDTALPADRLLSALQAIEARQGRRRAERWGPRTLDLDILTYGDLRSDTPTLRIPHPELARRDFVLLPLQELAPDLQLPGLGPLAALVAALPVITAQRLSV